MNLGDESEGDTPAAGPSVKKRPSGPETSNPKAGEVQSCNCADTGGPGTRTALAGSEPARS